MSQDSQQAITHVLQQDSKVLDSLLSKLKQLRQLQAILTEMLEPRLAIHCQVANLEGDCLIVITDSALWATQFRFLATQLLPKLRNHPQFYNLKNISCKIRPKVTHPSVPPVDKKPMPKLSIATAAMILESCKNITHNKLKEIMQKIARNTRSSPPPSS